MKRYINEFIKLKCASDLLAWGVFPNAKEITESMAMYHAVKNHVPFNLRDEEINLVVVGDGKSPRTAALFAVMTKWTCYSVDPKMDEKWLSCKEIKRLHAIKSKVEDIHIEFEKVVIVLPHSHAPIMHVLKHIVGFEERHIVAMPCCVPCLIPGVVGKIYEDENVWSLKNTILIYNNV